MFFARISYFSGPVTKFFLIWKQAAIDENVAEAVKELESFSLETCKGLQKWRWKELEKAPLKYFEERGGRKFWKLGSN